MNLRINEINRQLTLERELKLSHYLFLLFWISKPFYIYASGSIQPSDVIFLLSFIVWILEKRGEVCIDNGNIYFVYFVLFVFLINTVYALIYTNSVFIEKSFFYLYNLFVIIVFQDFIKNRRFLKYLLAITSLNIVTQAIIYVFNLGGRYLYGGLRYMGSFNDPNQLSFFLFSSFLLIYSLLYYFRKNISFYIQIYNLILFAIVLFLIFQGSSTGALLGVIAFVVALLLCYVTIDKTPMRIMMRLLVYGLLLLAISYLIMVLVTPDLLNSLNKDGSFIFTRLLEKINKMASEGLVSIIEERQISRVFSYPANLLYGAGEGLYGRFVETEALEIHSTVISLWFYYGCIPLIFIFLWMRKKLTKLPRALYPIYAGLLFESLILANQRQPIFWMLFVLADLSSSDVSKRNYFVYKK